MVRYAVATSARMLTSAARYCEAVACTRETPASICRRTAPHTSSSQVADAMFHCQLLNGVRSASGFGTPIWLASTRRRL